MTFNFYFFTLLFSLFFNLPLIFGQTYNQNNIPQADTTYPCKKMIYTMKSVGRCYYSSSPRTSYERYKEVVEIDGKEYKINRKNLNPYFKQFPDAFKKWKNYYTYSYIEGGFALTGLVSLFAAIPKMDSPSGKYYLGVGATSFITAAILSKIARKKRSRAFEIYNSHCE